MSLTAQDLFPCSERFDDPQRLLGSACFAPLVKPVRRNKTSAKSHRITECGFHCRCFRPGINHSRRARHVRRPIRNESPLHQREHTTWFLWMLANDGNWLRRGNVVARAPAFISLGIEVFLNDLLAPRKSIASANYVVSGISTTASRPALAFESAVDLGCDCRSIGNLGTPSQRSLAPLASSSAPGCSGVV